jgi:hypothetical protein
LILRLCEQGKGAIGCWAARGLAQIRTNQLVDVIWTLALDALESKVIHSRKQTI